VAIVQAGKRPDENCWNRAPVYQAVVGRQAQMGRAEVKVNGSQVKVFMPSSKVTVELDRESDDVLADK
jgi:hypothetical protein